MGDMGLSIVVINDRGRIVIPSKLRKNLKIEKGDAFIIIGLKNDVIVLKKIDVEKCLET